MEADWVCENDVNQPPISALNVPLDETRKEFIRKKVS